MRLDEMPIESLADAVRRRRVSAVACVEYFVERIARLNPVLNCYREVLADHALDAARQVDLRVASGEDPGRLAGVPIALKDNIVTDVGHTTCGSKMLEHFRGTYSATAARRLINAGALLIGKTNCDEFAMGSSTEHSAFGPTHNPWDVSRVPGGSSGGSAAAVAAGLCAAAIGSDTGGSIRQPAAFCGVVGVKPTYGRISRHGLVAFGSSLDQIGPLTRTVRDAALLHDVMAGPDARDSTSSSAPVDDSLAAIARPVEGARIGLPRQYLSDANDPAVNDAVHSAAETLRGQGATIIDVDLPLTDYGISTYYVLAPAEASSNLARYDGIRFGRRAVLNDGEGLMDLYARSRSEGFGPEVQRRIMLGTYVLSAGYYDAYYSRALRVRRLIKQEYDRAFEACDALLGPVAPTPAFAIGSKTDPLSMYLGDVYTVNANIAGICAIALPGGWTDVGGIDLPVGVQLQCQAFREITMFRVAHMLEVARPSLRRSYAG